MLPPSYSWFPSILRVGFAVCIGPYVLAGDFFLYWLPTASKPPPPHPPPAFLWRRSDFPAPGKQEQDSLCVRLCLLRRCLRLCVCTHAQPGPGRPSPSPFCSLKNEGGNLRAAVIIHPSKQTGRRQRRSTEGGRDGCREEERESQTGGMKGGWGDILTLISLYLVFRIPGCALSLSFLHSLPSVLASTLLGISCAGMCVFASVCGGWYAVYPNISYSVFCFLEQVSSSDTKRQDAVFQLSSLFVCKPFLVNHLLTFASL